MLNFVIKYRYQNGCSFVNNRSFAHHRSDNRNTDYRWNRISVRRRVVRAETRIMETSILITSVNGIKWRSYDIIDHPWIMLDLIFQWTSKSSRIITIRGDWTFFKYRFAILRSKFLERKNYWKKYERNYIELRNILIPLERSFPPSARETRLFRCESGKGSHEYIV